MQKMFLGFLVIVTLGVAGCGVKSDLARPDGYPRNYPVY
ncbi:MAG: lipoprotein [Alphaproteobacteria bacterium]|nr:lipoprotein [Alphaproteobacteria bacterium]